MQTYYVGSLDGSSRFEPVRGLSLADGIDRLMELSGTVYGLKRVDGIMTMAVHPLPARYNLDALCSAIEDDEAAKREIYLNIVSGRAGILAPYLLLPEVKRQ